VSFPGNCATPEETARWMARLAREDYGLPGVLPVMCSCVELTDAWTAPGCLGDVAGYLWPVDHCSVGLFQQQADDLGCGHFGWGTRAQLIEAPHALARFCEEAVKYKDHEWHESTTDPDALGRWCQAVQRSAFPDRYRDKGYPMASELLGAVSAAEHPESRKLLLDADGWAYDLETGAWLRSDRGEARFHTNVRGWLWAPPEERPSVGFEWPEASDPPVPGSPFYVDRHPTRYNWLPKRPDVEAWARYLAENFDCWVNTYFDHPEGYGRDADSFDVWGPGGRGDPIDPGLGDRIFRLLFDDPGLPNIEWIIWRAAIHGAWNGWAGEPFGTDPFSWHYDHIHVTYLPSS
jgi:hypothetical protein